MDEAERLNIAFKCFEKRLQRGQVKKPKLQRINKKPVTPFKSPSGRRLLQLKTQTADSLQSSIKNNGIETVSGIDSCRVDLASDTAALDACVSDMW